MKYMKRAKIYKINNCTFNPETKTATSYEWWDFVKPIEGKLVFNDCYYSNTTSMHQSKVRRLLSELGVKIDITLPCKLGLQNFSNLESLFVASEEYLCDKFLDERIKSQERSVKSRARKFSKKLTDYLENSICFRDYDILPASRFGQYNKIAVHQVVEDIEHDVQNALHNFQRDGFGSIVFYVEGI